MIAGLTAILFLLAPGRSLFMAEGDLDVMFGNGGTVTTAFPGFVANGAALAIQGDGKIVLAGWVYGDGVVTEFAMTRYNTDGSLDVTFGSAGKVVTPNFGVTGVINIAIQKDGKIVCGSAVKTNHDTVDMAAARYNPDGTLDGSFGDHGIAAIDFFGARDVAASMAIQGDGKIVLAGSAGDPNFTFGSNFALARFNADGTPDNAFGSGGKLTTEFFSGIYNVAGASAVAIGQDERIVVGGGASTVDGSDGAAVYARYNPDGTLDSTFGTGGKLYLRGGYGAAFNGLSVLDSGEMLALSAGTAATTGFTPHQFALSKFNANGKFDKSFGDSGHVLIDFGSSANPSGMVVEPNGKIVIAGTVAVAETTLQFAVARCLGDGSLDPSFGAGGKVITTFPGGAFAAAVSVQADGKIVVGGSALDHTTHYFALARYQGPTFDVCIQDDGTGDWIKFDSSSGDYVFESCNPTQFVGGSGKIRTKKAGCVFKLTDQQADRSLSATVNVCKKNASGSVTFGGLNFTLSDTDTADDTCSCR